jgi:hypothetical protein
MSAAMERMVQAGARVEALAAWRHCHDAEKLFFAVRESLVGP